MEPHKTNEGALWVAAFPADPPRQCLPLGDPPTLTGSSRLMNVLASRRTAKVLHKAGLLSDADLETMLAGLTELGEKVDSANSAGATDEDVHGAMERGLIEIVGPE